MAGPYAGATAGTAVPMQGLDAAPFDHTVWDESLNAVTDESGALVYSDPAAILIFGKTGGAVG